MKRKSIFLKVTFCMSFIAISILTLLAINHSYQKQQKQQKQQAKIAFAEFIDQHPYRQRKGMTEKALKAIPKKDRPDLAQEHDFLMTVDPHLKTVPQDRKIAALKVVQQRLDLQRAETMLDWEERGPRQVAGRTRALMFDPNDSSHKKVWAGGIAGGLWYNEDITDPNEAWQRVNDFWSNIAISYITYDPTEPQTFYVGTGEGWYNIDAVRGAGIWKSTDGGASWAQLSSTDNSSFYYIQRLAVTNTGRVLAGTRSGLKISDNDGQSWTAVNAMSSYISDIEIASDETIYVGERFDGQIYKSTNNGDTWTNISPLAGDYNRIELATAPAQPNTIYAVAHDFAEDGEDGDVDIGWMKKSVNGGQTWTDITVPAYTCSSTGSIPFTRGQGWYDLELSVHPTNPDMVFAGGVNWHRSTDGGTTWTTLSWWFEDACKPFVHADQHAFVWHPTNPNTVLVGNDGGVFYTTNIADVSTPFFEPRNNGYNVTQFYACAAHPGPNVDYFLAGAQDNGTQQFTQAGFGDTREVTGGDGAYCFIDQNDPDYQISSYIRNVYHRSTDGGNSFSNFYYDTEVGFFINPIGYDHDAHVLYGSANANELFRATNMTENVPNTTYVSIGGAGFGNASASHIKASPYSDNTLFVGTPSGGVYKVSQAQSAPIAISVDPNLVLPFGWVSAIDVGATEDQLLVTYSNYGIGSVWETLDGGQTWLNKEGNLPDMPVRWGIYNPNNYEEVLLATEVGVWKTDNFSALTQNWEPTNVGLANVRCDMLKYRASDGLVIVATHGRGLFTASLADDNFCSPATNLTHLETTSSEVTLSWTSPFLNTTNTFNISFKLESESDWQVIEGHTGTQITLTDLDTCSYYLARIQHQCAGGASIFSNIIRFYAPCSIPEYCEIGSSSTFEWIEKMTWSTVSRTSGNNGGYGDYLSDTIKLRSGVLYEVLLTLGFSNGITAGRYASIWMDKNRDGDWNDDTERIAANVYGADGEIRILVELPENTPEVISRLRIVLHQEASFDDPCTTALLYGETEDYIVWINNDFCDVATLSTTTVEEETVLIQWMTTNAMKYIVRYRLDSEMEWIVSDTIHEDNFYTIANPISCVAYTYQIQSICEEGKVSDFSPPKTFRSSCSEHCAVAGDANSEWIQRVTIGDIDVVSDHNENAGYTDFSHLSTELNIITPHTITLEPGYNGTTYVEYWQVWIDWNHDFLFTTEELLFQSDIASDAAVTGQIVIPSTAVLDTVIMRVMMIYDENLNDPCLTSLFFGEVEDYSIVITNHTLDHDLPCAAIPIPIESNCTPIAVDLTSATDSGVEFPPCASYQGADVWLRTQVPASGTLGIETGELNIRDTGMAIYRGDCNNLTLMECDDDGTGSLMSRIVLEDLMPGETIYIRVWEYGNNAPVGSTFICAYDGANIQVSTRFMLFLEGAMAASGTTMERKEGHVVPTTQPYNTAPWNYAGSESVAEMPDNVIDWLFIEAVNQDHQVVEQKAVLLTETGFVIAVNGSDHIVFDHLELTEYYHFIIRHRNHIDIMTSYLLPTNELVGWTWDVNIDVFQVYDYADQLLQLSSGYWALRAGDFDGNGIINVTDFNRYQSQIGATNYSDADCSLDGQVLIQDFNAYQTNAAHIGIRRVRYD